MSCNVRAKRGEAKGLLPKPWWIDALCQLQDNHHAKTRDPVQDLRPRGELSRSCQRGSDGLHAAGVG